MKTCKECKKYNRKEDRCEIYGEIISVLCCKDFEKKKPTKRKFNFLFIKS